MLDVANLLTLAGLAFAVACALLAIAGHLAYAVVALMLSGFCDLFDGVLARRAWRNAQLRDFGRRLDSLVDACSFGLAPVVLMYASGLDSPFEIALLIGFAACAVWRLACFDTAGLVRRGDRRYFAGLPTTYVALVLPVAFLAGFFGRAWLRISVTTALIGLALAMVSLVPIRKPTGAFRLLLTLLGAVIVGVLMTFADRLAC